MIQTNFEKVRTFMRTFGQEVKTRPDIPDGKTVNLRIELIAEELCFKLKKDLRKLKISIL